MFVRDYTKNRRIKSNKTYLFGFLNDGLDEGSFVDNEGDRWTTTSQWMNTEIPVVGPFGITNGSR